MSNRIDQINSLIKENLGPILFESIEQKEFGLITITKVSTAKNLDSTKIWISCLTNAQKLLPHLNEKIYHIQKDLNRKLVLRRIPKIIFKLDENNEYVEKIENLMK